MVEGTGAYLRETYTNITLSAEFSKITKPFKMQNYSSKKSTTHHRQFTSRIIVLKIF